MYSHTYSTLHPRLIRAILAYSVRSHLYKKNGQLILIPPQPDVDLNDQPWSHNYRDEIADAYDAGILYKREVTFFMNGDSGDMYVMTRNNTFTLIDVDDEYMIIKDNKIVCDYRRCYVECILYSLARLLRKHQIAEILNANRDRLESYCVHYRYGSEDYGYDEFLIYRNGENDVFHVLGPDEIATLDVNYLMRIDAEETQRIMIDHEEVGLSLM